MDFYLEMLKKRKEKNITFYWGTDLIIKGIFHTFYETDNGLEMDDPNYIEYEATAIQIKEVIHDSKKEIMSPAFYTELKAGKYMEISELNCPTKVVLENGEIIWGTEN